MVYDRAVQSITYKGTNSKKKEKKNAKRTYKPRDRKTKKVKKHERKKDMGKEQRLKREI